MLCMERKEAVVTIPSVLVHIMCLSGNMWLYVQDVVPAHSFYYSNVQSPVCLCLI